MYTHHPIPACSPCIDPIFEKAHAFQREIGLLDLHVDSIVENRLFGYDLTKKHRRGVPGQPFFWHADIPRMIEAGYGGACMGIHYFPWESERGWEKLLRQIEYLDQIAVEKNGAFRVYSPSDWDKAREKKLLALAPVVEGAHMLHGKLSRVETLSRMGVAYLTLAHFSQNAFATPSMGIGANETKGLTGLGCDLVRELNRFGIVIDVAHVNRAGVLEVCSLSRSPVLCSHTGVKGIYPSARNISDEEIAAIASTGGVMGIIFAPHFLCGKLRKDTKIVLSHLEYIIQKAGIEHVALGSDYDGWLPAIPLDHRDCRDIVHVTHGLWELGYSEADLALILRENVLRVMKETWRRRS